jgi:hypothetical protein
MPARPRSRKCAESVPGTASGSARDCTPGRWLEGSGALEPPGSVAETVSSLTIADTFIAAGQSPAPPPPPPQLPRRFICSFPDCSAHYNKAWKLDAHLCKHTGEVTGRGGAWRPPGTGEGGGRPLPLPEWPGAGCLEPGVQGPFSQTCSAVESRPWLRDGAEKWARSYRTSVVGPRYSCHGFRAS